MLPDVDKKLEKQVIIKMAGYLEKKGRMVSILHYITYSMSRVPSSVHKNIRFTSFYISTKNIRLISPFTCWGAENSCQTNLAIFARS